MKRLKILIIISALIYCFQTGFSVSAEDTEMSEACASETDLFAGDLNLDGHVSILDVIILNRAILGKEILSEFQNQIADINQDGIIDSSDSLAIMKRIVGLNQ